MSVGRDILITPKALIQLTNAYCETTRLFTKDGYFAKLRAQRFIDEVVILCVGITDAKLRHEILKAGIKQVIQRGEIPEALAKKFYEIYFQNKRDIEENVRYKTYEEFITHQSTKFFNVITHQAAKQQNLKIHKIHFFSKVSDVTLVRTYQPFLFRHCKLKTNNNAHPVDVTGRLLKDGWYMYVIMPNKEIRFLPNYSVAGHGLNYQKYRSHSQLSGGLPVLGAGCFEVVDGKIIKLDGSSGHYKTSNIEYVEQAKNIFAEKGMDMSETLLEKAFIPERATTQNRFFRKCRSAMRGLFFTAKRAENRPSRKTLDEHWQGWIPKRF